MGVVRQSSEVKEQRVWPWNILGDNLSAAWGILLIALPSPIMVPTMMVSVKIWDWIQAYIISKEQIVSLVDQASDVIFNASFKKHYLRNPKDVALMPMAFFITLYAPLLYAAAVYFNYYYGFSIVMMLLYHQLRIGLILPSMWGDLSVGPRFRFFAHTQVLLHREGHDHKGWFKGPLEFLNHKMIQFISGVVYGTLPYQYMISHNKIHHRYHNNLRDVHTNFDLDRTKFKSFLQFEPRFFLYWISVTPLIEFCSRKHVETKYVLSLLGGIVYWGLWVYLNYCFVGFWFALTYCVYPLFEATAFLGAIAYLWHAFADADNPSNPQIVSFTILNGMDNIWNEDYHSIHHHSPLVHFADAPQHYLDHQEQYENCTGTVFTDTEEGELLYWLFAKKWDKMAEHFVDLSGTLTHKQKKELILRRLSYRLPVEALKQ